VTDIKTELRIPDLWFDFYARFLPGVAFVTTYRLVIRRDSSFPSGASEILCLAFIGYFCALITQPLASMFTGWIERFLENKLTPEKEDYVQAVSWYLSALLPNEQQQAGIRQAMILSKMHGETTFFVQLLVLGAFVFVLQFVSSFPLCIYSIIFNFLCEILFLGGAFEVAYRRLIRAKKLYFIYHTK